MGKKSILYAHRIEPRFLGVPIDYIPRPVPETSSGDEISIPCRVYPAPVSLEAFTRFMKMTDYATIWPREALILILLLWGASYMILRHRAGRLSVMTRGYLLLDDELFEYFYRPIVTEYESEFGELFRGSTPPLSAEDFLAELAAIQGSTWPLRFAPVLRREGTMTCIDLIAASECLESLLQAPIGDGRIPNIRAQHFELLTQDLINQSSWKPTAEVEKLRGRTLRIRGEAITDIDAIGEQDGKILAVSCKAWIYSGAYDCGDYRAVRNLASATENAVEEWQRKSSLLYAAGKGDNFDLSKFSRIIPVVCTLLMFMSR